MYIKFFKRAIELFLCILLLPFLLVISIVVAILIVVEDRGSPFFIAVRMGMNGRKYRMYKFRSMYINAPDIRNPDGSTYNADNDLRITRIGKFLRRTSIDELPQIINVIIGNMSLIGPRPTMIPDIPYDNLDPKIKKRYSVRPGITGYSQAFFRNSISQDNKFKYDNYYIDHISLMLDMKIVVKTIATVIKRDYINNSDDYKMV